MEMNQQKVGRHLIIDATVHDAKVFSHESLKKLMVNLSKILDMKILMGPDFVDVDVDASKLNSVEFQDEGGTTGMAVVSTSHMSLHSWPLRKFFHMDVFSCKDFDSESAIKYIAEHLQITDMSVMDVLRFGSTIVPKVVDSYQRSYKWDTKPRSTRTSSKTKTPSLNAVTVRKLLDEGRECRLELGKRIDKMRVPTNEMHDRAR